jgi:hypothetical protein
MHRLRSFASLRMTLRFWERSKETARLTELEGDAHGVEEAAVIGGEAIFQNGVFAVAIVADIDRWRSEEVGALAVIARLLADIIEPFLEIIVVHQIPHPQSRDPGDCSNSQNKRS